MRIPYVVTAAAVLMAYPASAQIERVRMPLQILRSEGEAPRLGEVSLRAGSYAEDAAFSFSAWFNGDTEALGAVETVAWTVKFRDYCSNEPSWVRGILIGPSGQIWRGQRVFAPPGPDRGQNWSTGSTGARPGINETSGLIEAVSRGGLFTAALEDQLGRRWNETTFDTLARDDWEKMFEVNQKSVRAADPDMPIHDRLPLIAVTQETFILPNPPRPCP